MKQSKIMPMGRIAFREENKFWNAYYAASDTMEGAILLGSILMHIVREHPTVKDDFVALMRDVIDHCTEETVGERPVWHKPVPAPEDERSSE